MDSPSTISSIALVQVSLNSLSCACFSGREPSEQPGLCYVFGGQRNKGASSHDDRKPEPASLKDDSWLGRGHLNSRRPRGSRRQDRAMAFLFAGVGMRVWACGCVCVRDRVCGVSSLYGWCGGPSCTAWHPCCAIATPGGADRRVARPPPGARPEHMHRDEWYTILLHTPFIADDVC